MDTREQAKEKRALAARARRWATMLHQVADIDRLNRLAETLEKEALALEQGHPEVLQPPSRTTVQMQTQAQQQQESPSGSKKEDTKS